MSEPTPEMIDAGFAKAAQFTTVVDRQELAAIYTAMRALERPSDEAVERSELLELLELGGDYATLVFNRCPDESSELALAVKTDIERFNKARAAIAAMQEQGK